MQNRHTTIYAKDVKPINFCGKTVMWQMELDGLFEIPFDIEPTVGEHDFNTCEKCQKTLESMTRNLTNRYQGKAGRKGFPFCCPGHVKLMNYEEFVRSKDFFSCVPEMVAKKVVYTNQHIKNNYNRDDWFKEITDYIVWVIESFGQMPNDTGESLYLSDYFHAVTQLYNSDSDIPDEKKIKLDEFFKPYRTKSNKSTTDLAHLLAIYEKWINIFPFPLKNYFGDLRAHFENQLPLFNGKPEYNKYSQRASVSAHTKRSLLLYLHELTKVLLHKIDANKLVTEGLIVDLNRHKFELESEILRTATNKLTLDLSKGENQYLKTLKKWLELHKTYFSNISPLLLSTPEPTTELSEASSPTKRIPDPS